MKNFLKLLLLLLVVIVLLGGCATTTGMGDRTSCLKKLEGTWEGEVITGGYDSAWAAGGTKRTLIVYHASEGTIIARFGARTLGLLPVNISVLDAENCKPTISFYPALIVVPDWITLMLVGDNALQGTYMWPTGKGITIRLWRVPS